MEVVFILEICLLRFFLSLSIFESFRAVLSLEISATPLVRTVLEVLVVFLRVVFLVPGRAVPDEGLDEPVLFELAAVFFPADCVSFFLLTIVLKG